MGEWVKASGGYYITVSVLLQVGHSSFQEIIRDFQAVISKEIKEQILEKKDVFRMLFSVHRRRQQLAIGAFYNFIDDEGVLRLIGCEAGGRGVSTHSRDSCNYLCWQGRYFSTA